MTNCLVACRAGWAQGDGSCQCRFRSNPISEHLLCVCVCVCVCAFHIHNTRVQSSAPVVAEVHTIRVQHRDCIQNGKTDKKLEMETAYIRTYLEDDVITQYPGSWSTAQ